MNHGEHGEHGDFYRKEVVICPHQFFLCALRALRGSFCSSLLCFDLESALWL